MVKKLIGTAVRAGKASAKQAAIARAKARKAETQKKAKQNEIDRIQNKKQISENELRRVSSLRNQVKSLGAKIKTEKAKAIKLDEKTPPPIKRNQNIKAGGPSYPKKKSSTPTQRAFGGGQRRGLSKGRKQGAAVVGTIGLSVATILAIRSKERLEKLKQENLDANQRAAVNKALRIVAQKEAAKAKMGGTKPKPRPKK